NGVPVHKFDPAHPLVIQITYDPAELGDLDPATLKIGYFDVTNRRWLLLPATVDTVNHTVTALTTHFTLFQIRATARTRAQVKSAQARLAALAAAGAPRVRALPAVQPVVGGVPFVVILPG